MLYFKAKKQEAHSTSSVQAGFTIIETLTALFVFMVIIAVVSNVLSVSLNLFRRAQEVQRMQEDVAFVLESMAKEIRVSEICNTPPVCTQQALTITHPLNGVISYGRNSSTNIVEKNYIGVAINELSSSDVVFTKMDFYITGTGTGAGGLGTDDMQPKVTIVAKVQGKIYSEEILNVQTTITSRDVSVEFEN